MNTLIKAVACAAVLAAPIAAFAQTSQPVTHAEVTTELKQLESVGYDPASSYQAAYPANIQAAEARVEQKYGTANSSYGPATSGSAQSGGTVTQSN